MSPVLGRRPRWPTLSVPARRRRWPTHALIAAVASCGWLPFLGKALSPDEGGYLLIGSQWSPGTSLYGNYWVDRPPLLIAVFAGAAHSGGAIALRLIGTAAVVGSVLLSALLGRQTRPGSAGPSLVPALVTAVFLASPMFGTAEVDGEVLAVPFVLAGASALLVSWRTENRTRRLAYGFVAGCCGAAAALVKQNVIDVFVLAIAVAIGIGVRGRVHDAWTQLTAVAAGAIVTASVVLGLAWTRGTSPAGVWDAVVVFRLQATAVMHSYSTSGMPPRFYSLVHACLLSGAPAVAAAAAWRLRARLDPADLEEETSTSRPPRPQALDLRWPAVAVILWEVVAMGLGGSYWSHYLIGVVPGLVLLVVAAGQRRTTRTTDRAVIAAGIGWAAVAAVVGVASLAARLIDTGGVDAATVAYLRAHAVSGDTAVVAFGHPDIVQETGMSSPYPELWSLPVRVRDSNLATFDDVLRGPHAPTWVVVSGTALATWGVHPVVAQATLERRYHAVAETDSYRVYLLDDLSRPSSTDLAGG